MVYECVAGDGVQEKTLMVFQPPSSAGTRKPAKIAIATFPRDFSRKSQLFQGSFAANLQLFGKIPKAGKQISRRTKMCGCFLQ